MRRLFYGLGLTLLLALPGVSPAQGQKLSASEAKAHEGESATVCGTVASARYVASSKGQPTFLNLDKPYPNEVFTILIWGDDRSKFGEPETKYANSKVCVTGNITDYRGTPEIVASDPTQITMQ